MLKTTKPSLLLTLGAATLLVGGGVAAYYAVVSHQFAENLPTGAKLIPKEAMMAVSLSTNPQQWQQLQTFGTSQSKAAWNEALKQWRDRIFTNNGYDYQRDIQPWVGDQVMIAFLPNSSLISSVPPQPNSTGVSPGHSQTVVVFPIENPLKAKELLSQPKTVPQGKITKRTYRGIEITETQGTPTQNYSVAVLEQDFVIVTTNPTAIDQVIDTYRGEDSLAKIAGYPAAIETIKNPSAFAEVYFNIPVATTVASYSTNNPIPPDKLEQIQQNQGFATSVNLASEGISFQAVSWLKPNSQKKFTVENQADQLLQRIPQNALMMVSGGNLQRLWQDYRQGANDNPMAPFNPDALSSSLQKSTGLELEKDLLSWMDGEFALSLIPVDPNQKTKELFVAGLGLMVEVRDRNAAEQSLKKLDEVMQGKNFKISEDKINGQSVVKWVSPFGGYSVIRGWLSDNIAFATLGAPVANQIVPSTPAPITTNPLFKQTVPMALTPNNGHFFLNLEQIFDPKAKSLSLPELPPQQKVWVNAIESIGVTAAVTNERTTRYDAFIKLKKTN